MTDRPTNDAPRGDRAEDRNARLFVGARISIATANALAACAETLARRARDAGIDVRWVSPASYHVTLKFLGWTRSSTIGAIRDGLTVAVADAAQAVASRGSRLSFRTARLGGFPSLERASVVWAGIEDGGLLTELATRIDTAMVSVGFAVERRPFHPHVTLGRLREIRGLKEVVLPVSEQMFGESRLDAVILYESETKSSGSQYKEIHRIDFKTASDRPSEGAERQTTALHLDPQNRSTQSAAEVDDTDDGWPRGHH
ncbi:MAG: RNA 2',3'-cyclic phosphodiesterase [Kofleriaceae bacterium]